MSEMEKNDMHEMLSDEDLEIASGGKIYIVKENKMMYCPYCESAHNISVLKGTHMVGYNMYTVYRCNRKGKMFIKKPNGYFDMNDDRLVMGGLVD